MLEPILSTTVEGGLFAVRCLVCATEHSDHEIRVVCKRSHIPSREKNIGSESCPRRVFEEFAERIPAPGAEPDNCPAVLAEMGAKAIENRNSCTGSKECHDVAGRHYEIERFVDTDRGEIEFGEILDDPSRTRMVLFGCRDEHGIDIDADDAVTGAMQIATGPSRATTGVEDVRPARGHSVDESSLTVHVGALTLELAEAFDVPVGMLWVLGDLLHPEAWFSHAAILADRRNWTGEPVIDRSYRIRYPQRLHCGVTSKAF